MKGLRMPVHNIKMSVSIGFTYCMLRKDVIDTLTHFLYKPLFMFLMLIKVISCGLDITMSQISFVKALLIITIISQYTVW